MKRTDETATDGIWTENPSLPVSASVARARFAWAYTTESKLEIDPQDPHLSLPTFCLNQEKTVCLSKALVVTTETMPTCLLSHLFVRATYLRGGYSVSLLEISKVMFNTRKQLIFCADGSPPVFAEHAYNSWLKENMPDVSHIGVTLRCPATSPTDRNVQGFLVINFHGNCSIPTSEHIFADSADGVGVVLPKTTSAMFYATPTTRTFEQAWPELTRAADKYPIAKRHEDVAFQFSTCAMAAVFDTNAPFMSHWLWHMYHRVKVDHVVMYTAPEAYDLDSKNINGTFVRELLSNGFLQLLPWHSRFIDKTQIFYRSQWSAYTDYAYRFRGLCQWTLFADVDDFFVSWPSNHNIVPIIQQATADHPRDVSFRLRWPTFLPQCQNINGRSPPFNSDDLLPNLRYGDISMNNCKSISNTYDYFDLGIHTQPGDAHDIRQPGTAMYHVRAGDLSIRGVGVLTQETCAKFKLDDYPLETLKKLVFPIVD